MEYRGGGAVAGADDVDGGGDEGVVPVVVGFGIGGGIVIGGFDFALDVVGVVGRAVDFEGIDDVVDFGVGGEGALGSDLVGGAWGDEEHVAATDELVGAAAVEDGAAVDFGGDFEGDAAGEVGFDDACDDVDGGALGGDDEVDACGAGELGEASDAGFNVGGGDHHEVGEFVDDADDVGEFIFRNGEVRVARNFDIVDGGAFFWGEDGVEFFGFFFF